MTLSFLPSNLHRPGYKPPPTEAGKPAPPILSSPRSVHVCMLSGVDPLNLLEKELKDFEKPGLSPELVQMAYEHHITRREEKMQRLLNERAKLPEDFEPPKKIFSAKPSAAPKTPRHTPGKAGSRQQTAPGARQPRSNTAAAEAMHLLGDSTMMRKHAEKADKQAKQQASLEANRQAYQDVRDQIQREYDEKMAKVNARFVLVKAEQKRRELERQNELYEKGQERVRAAEEFEAEERRKAEENFQEEMRELERQRQERLKEKQLQEEARLERDRRVVEWKEKTAAIRQEQQDQIDSLRAQLDARDRKLEEYQQNLNQLRAERLAASKQGRNAAIAANLARANEIEEARKAEWVERRLARDAYVAAVKAAENKEGKKAERDRLANEKRVRVYNAAVERERARVAKIEDKMEKQRLHMIKLEEERKAEKARRNLERQLLIQDRQERVENVGRMQEVERMMTREKIEESLARGKLMMDTKAAMAAERQLQNCQKALRDSARRVEVAEEQRLSSRARWLDSVNNQKKLFAAASHVKTTPRSSRPSTAGPNRLPRTPVGKTPRPMSSRAGSMAGTPAQPRGTPRAV